MDNLFTLVMEAGGNLAEPFDAGGADMAPQDMAAPPDTSAGDPPPLDTGGADNSLATGFDMSGDDLGGGDDGMGGFDDASSDDGSGNDEEQPDNGGVKLSAKANSILNQKLYQQMMGRNQEIEDTIENLNEILPLLPSSTIHENDEPISNLKAALDAGKKYLLQSFVDAKYGENLIYFQKLDALYTLLMEQINTNLKKLKADNNQS